MKLSELLKGVEGHALQGRGDPEVQSIVHRASTAKPGCCFVAIPGAKADGHRFVGEAIERGAVVVVTERPIDLAPQAVDVVVPDSRLALALMSAVWFGEPSRKLALVGVTGTNGKTTVTYVLEGIFARAGLAPGVIGTVERRFGGERRPASHTTPDSSDLQELLAEMVQTGARACAMEVSSHALVQQRVAGCHFDGAIFTNLTPEHLDYHADLESYFEAKALLFEQLLASSAKKKRFAAINVDDPYGKRLASCLPLPVIRYGFGADAEILGRLARCDAGGLELEVHFSLGTLLLRSRLCGRFNALNILAAVAAAEGLGIDREAIRAGVEDVGHVPGRFESVPNSRGVLALVDYAHTPDALENVLVHARELSRGRVIVVFGCGGDRDRAKRPLMGRAAGRLADVQLVTSDNPRTEEAGAIVAEILPGLSAEAKPLRNGKGYEVIADRKSAIARAVEMAAAEDVLVVAGKGHEDYQIVGTARHHFDDREVLRELFARGA